MAVQETTEQILDDRQAGLEETSNSEYEEYSEKEDHIPMFYSKCDSEFDEEGDRDKYRC